MPRPIKNRKKRSKKRGRPRRKVCPVCADKLELNYKRTDVLERFITERGKIVPRRISGVCAKHQRKISLEIKRARHIALLPYTVLGE